jgi:hypothetical protein
LPRRVSTLRSSVRRTRARVAQLRMQTQRAWVAADVPSTGSDADARACTCSLARPTDWARNVGWSRGGLLPDSAVRHAGRTADASGRRKLRAEEEGSDASEARRAAALRPAPR